MYNFESISSLSDPSSRQSINLSGQMSLIWRSRLEKSPLSKPSKMVLRSLTPISQHVSVLIGPPKELDMFFFRNTVPVNLSHLTVVPMAGESHLQDRDFYLVVKRDMLP